MSADTKYRFDFKQIAANVDMEQVIQLCGLQPIERKGPQLRFACPACKSPRGFGVNLEKKRFNCFGSGCTAHGDAIALVALVKQCKPYEAAQMLTGTVNSPAPRTVQQVRSTVPTASPSPAFDPDKYAQRLDPEHEALARLGLSPDTLREFKSGYASNGLNRGRLALRINDRTGKCMGYVGYALAGEQPTIVAPNGMGLSDHIFGADRVKPGPLYLVRDPLQVLTAYESGQENVIAFLSDITAHSLTMLTSLMDTTPNETVDLF